MPRLRQPWAVLIFALMYCATGIGLEFEHHDDEALALEHSSVLSSRGHGGTSHRIPLEDRRVCPACAQSVQRIGTPAAALAPPETALICTGVVVLSRDELFSTERHSFGTRAPPAFPA